MKITLYEFDPTRSRRYRLTSEELGLPFESVTGPDPIGSDRLKAVHSLVALPAVEIEGKALFESAAVCTYLADTQPKKGLVAANDTWARALQHQWTYFVLSEMEIYTWTLARNEFVALKKNA